MDCAALCHKAVTKLFTFYTHHCEGAPLAVTEPSQQLPVVLVMHIFVTVWQLLDCSVARQPLPCKLDTHSWQQQQGCCTAVALLLPVPNTGLI